MILVTLVPGGAPVTKSKTYNLDNELKTVPGSFLFDHLAQFAADFVIQVLITTQLPLNYHPITTQWSLNYYSITTQLRLNFGFLKDLWLK